MVLPLLRATRGRSEAAIYFQTTAYSRVAREAIRVFWGAEGNSKKAGYLPFVSFEKFRYGTVSRVQRAANPQLPEALP